MAQTDVGLLVLKLEARINAFEKNMNRAAGVTRSTAAKIDKSVSSVNRRIDLMGSTVRNFIGPMSLLASLLGAKELTEYADAWKLAQNRLGAAGVAHEQMAATLEHLNGVAKDTRSGFDETVRLYSRLYQATEQLGTSSTDVAKATETINKAFKAGGAATSEQAAGILQLSQALAAGNLQGDELRSVRENAPLLARAIAAEFETTIGGLKKLGSEGLITSDRVIKAILNAADDIDARFNKTTATIGDAFTHLRNRLITEFGRFAQESGLAAGLTQGVVYLADNIDNIGRAATIAGAALLGAFGPRMLLSLTASSGALLSMLGPIGLVAGAISAAAAAAAFFGDQLQVLDGQKGTVADYAAIFGQDIRGALEVAAAAAEDLTIQLINQLSEWVEASGISTESVLSFFHNMTNKVIGLFVFMASSVENTFNSLPAAVADASVRAMNWMIENIESGLNAVIEKVNQFIDLVNSAVPDAVGNVAQIPTLELSRVTNEFAGVQAEMARTQEELWNSAMTRDYVGEVANLIKTGTEDIQQYLDTVRQRANQRRAGIESGADINGPEEAYDSFYRGRAPGTMPTGADTGGGGGKSGGSGKTPAQQYQEDAQALEEKIQMMELEKSMLGATAREQEYMIQLQELLNEAHAAGVPITQEVISNAEALAWAYADAKVSLDEARESQDRITSAAEDWNATIKSATQNWITDLIEGKSAAEALANALESIGQKFLEMGLDQLFRSFTMGAGQSGGLGGLLANLFSFHKGGIVGRDWERYHTGGLAGLRHDEVGAILQKGEQIIPKEMVGKQGTQILIDMTDRRQIDARGADSASVARLEQMMLADRQQRYAETVRIFRIAQSRGAVRVKR